MSEQSAGARQKLGWILWAIVYEAYCALRYPGRRWRMVCPYCASEHTARSWNMVVLKTDVHVSNADSNVHVGRDATTAADLPGEEGRKNPTLEARGGWFK
jgi:RNA polymerase subunit RPABC4/transcription elongation factor Spt4